MGKWARGICCAVLAAAVAATPVALRGLPAGDWAGEEAGYAGAVRLWVWRGFSAGEGWLRACAARFERANPGVYVHIAWKSEAEMGLCASGEIGRPDGALFPTGMLAEERGLIRLEAPEGLRVETSPWALPVAMSGYLWCGGVEERAVVCPPDSDRRCYSAALLAACARREGQEAPRKAGEGMNVGLPTAEPQQGEAVKASHTLLALAEEADAAGRLRRGEARAALLARGEWAGLWEARGTEAGAPGAPFTDLVAWYAVPEGSNPERTEAARAFGAFLLEEKSQAALTQWGAFRVTEGPALYEGDAVMSALEEALAGPELLLAPAFGDGWRAVAGELLEAFLRGGIDAWEGVERLRRTLEEARMGSNRPPPDRGGVNVKRAG